MIKGKIIGLAVCAAVTLASGILPQTAMAATPWTACTKTAEQETESIPTSVAWRRKPASAPTQTPAFKLPYITRPAELPPTPEPAAPTPTSAPEPGKGYALCSCGAILSPEELVPHMKAHALKGESHSYSAY